LKINLYYYSTTGNTKLVCEKLRKEIPGLEIYDILDRNLNLNDECDIYGFAVSTYYLNLPPVFIEFINSLKVITNKPAFFLITYGMMPGKSVRKLADYLKNKGFSIIDYHLLRMPESYPVFIAKKRTDINAPGQKEMMNFMNFISGLKEKAKQIESGNIPDSKLIKPGLLNSIIPSQTYKKIMKQFGTLNVNTNLCNHCKICFNSCPYGAIEFKNEPVFNMGKCTGCYICYNKCPNAAVYTNILESKWQYSGPSKKLEEKFI
jgi:ferredoxin/flavodoxin